MKFKIFILIMFVLAVHGCGQGYRPNSPDNTLQKTKEGLGFRFSPNSVSISTDQDSVAITGDCAIGAFPVHYVEWRYGTNSGRLPGICSNNRFSVAIPRQQVNMTPGNYVLTAQIYGVDAGGNATAGPTDTLYITITAAGGNGGGAPAPAPKLEGCQDPGVRQYCQQAQPPNRFDLVLEMAQRFRDQLSRCGRRNNEFISEVVKELRKTDQRWGLNWVRGVEGDWNGDVISYYYGTGEPTERSVYASLIDIVVSCGEANQVTWNVITGPDVCCNPTGLGWTIVPLQP